MLFEFDSLEAAMEVAADRELMDTPAWRDAVAYILENAPPEVQQQLREGLKRFFPNLQPAFVDDQGNKYYSVEALQQELGMSDEDMKEALREMESRRGSCCEVQPKQLHRIQ